MESSGINWYLEHIETKEEVPIKRCHFHVGRSEHMDLICTSVNVSRRHADILIYIDGSLHIKDNSTINGTFINQRQIVRDEIASVNVGDEVGFGSHSQMALANASSSYVYLAKRKEEPVAEQLKIEITDSPQSQIGILSSYVTNNAHTSENITHCNNYVTTCTRVPVVALERYNGSLLASSSSSNSNSLIENTAIENNMGSSTENMTNLPGTSGSEQVKQVNELGYVVDEDGCIVIDSNTDDVLIKKEPMSFNVNNDAMFNDTIFCNMKKELEGLDRYDGDFMPTYYVDSEYECSQDWNSIFDVDEGSKSPLPKENCSVDNTISNTNNYNNKTSMVNTKNKINEKKYDVPPIVAPHFEKNAEVRNKRKSQNELNPNGFKKIKTNSFYDKNMKPPAPKISPVENIQEVRKRKLKEIAEKVNNNQLANKPSKSSTAKVKVSDSRGKFLATPCDVSTTSKVRNSTMKPPRKSANCINKMKMNSSKCNGNDSTIPIKANKIKVSNKDNQVDTVPKKISLYPTSTIIATRGRTQKNGYNNETEHAVLIKDVEDIILVMLAWSVSWFSDRNYNDKLPNLTKHPLRRMNKSFTSYLEYNNTVMPLLMVEVWNFLYKEVDFNFTNEPIIYFALQKETVRTKYIELECLTYLPKDKNLKEGDVIVLQLYLENKKCETEPLKVAVLGYVVYVYKKNLVDRDMPSTSKGQRKPNVTVTARIMIQRIAGTLNKSAKNRPFFQYITSFISSARTIRSIKYLEKSLLCQHILRPSIDLYRVAVPPSAKLYLKNELNKVQHEAVNEARNICLSNKPSIYLIHGPPGTGKTTVIINIILSVIFDPLFKDKCLLVTAPTNAGVDELALRIISAKTQLQDHLRKMVDMIRIGPKNSIRAEVQDYSLYECARRTLWRDLLKHESIENRRKLKELKDKMDFWRIHKNTSNGKLQLKSAASEFEESCREILGRSYNERIFECEDVLLKGARIICTTLSSCASVRMEKVFKREPGKISCCIVDESTQSMESETLIPLILRVDKLILVGDPKQLPALSFAKESKTYGFGESLFSRIDSNFKNAQYNPIKFLKTQYRMHPAICLFPNKEFYDGKLKNAAMLFNRKSPLNMLQPYLVFRFQGDTDNTEEYRNKSEILCVMLLLEAIVSKIPDTCTFSIGIITPYNDQKDGIIQNIRKKTFRNNVSITVNTVDSFQGRENDIIIMSCVRYHANNFLSDDQRLNVALTRARYALYIIGSTNLFMSCLKFGKIRKDADSRKLLKNLDTRMPMSALTRIIFIH